MISDIFWSHVSRIITLGCFSSLLKSRQIERPSREFVEILPVSYTNLIALQDERVLPPTLFRKKTLVREHNLCLVQKNQISCLQIWSTCAIPAAPSPREFICVCGNSLGIVKNQYWKSSSGAVQLLSGVKILIFYDSNELCRATKMVFRSFYHLQLRLLSRFQSTNSACIRHHFGTLDSIYEIWIQTCFLWHRGFPSSD